MRQYKSPLVQVVGLFTAWIVSAFIYFFFYSKQQMNSSYEQSNGQTLFIASLTIVIFLAFSLVFCVALIRMKIRGQAYDVASWLGIASALSLTLFGTSFSIFIQQMIHGHSIEFFSVSSVDKLSDVDTLLSFLIAAPTIIGLLCTYLATQEHLFPEALGFKDVLRGLYKFVINNTKNGQKVYFTFCCHYPGFGIAKYNEFKDDYENLYNVIFDDKNNIRCINLPLKQNVDYSLNEDGHAGSKSDQERGSRRPDSINAAIREFIDMWWENPTEKAPPQPGPRSPKESYDQAIKNMSIVFERAKGTQRAEQFRCVPRVPEYILMMAYRDKDRSDPFSAYLVFPLVIPGLIELKPKMKSMFGLQIENVQVIESLHEIVQKLDAISELQP